MNPNDNDPLHAAINAKLAVIVETSPTTPAWHDAWMRLGPGSTEEERLAVYQAIRDSGYLPPDAGFHLVSWQIDAMASLEAETSLRGLDDRMKAMKKACELETGEPWPPDDLSPEYEDLLKQYHAAWERIFLAKLEAFGEQEMADLYRADREEFDRRGEAGREYFHGPEDPEAWLDELVEEVAGCMTADSPMGPLGYRYGDDDGPWQIDLYPTPVELIGGAVDGEVVDPGFSLDIEQLRGLFDRIDFVAWQSLGFPGGEGPHVSIEGVYQGHDVFIQVLAYAPDDEEPGMKLDTTRRGDG